MANSKKVNKWDAAPVSIKNMRNYISESWVNYAAPPCCPPLDPSCQDSICESMMRLLESVLDDYNELEARHQKDTGMISEYEEENKNLKNKLDIMTDENDCLITRVFKQDEEYTKLEAEHKKLQETHDLCMKAHLRLCDDSTKLATENAELRSQYKSKDDALQKMIKEVAELEKEKIDLEVRLSQSDDLRYRSAKYAWAIKTILKKATFSPGHVAEELRFMARKSTTPKDVQERWEGYADELLGEHSKLVDKINRLEKKNEELEKALNDKKFTVWEEVESEIFTPEEIAESQFRVEHMLCNAMGTHYIQLMADENKWLKKKNEEVKKENDNLKQTLLNILEKLETKVGLCRIHLLDSYENRANLIMVEHDKLLIKYEKLKEENNNLTTDAKRLSDAVNAWFDMFNDMRHKRDFLKKECEKLKETNNSLRRSVRILDEEGYCGCITQQKPRSKEWFLIFWTTLSQSPASGAGIMMNVWMVCLKNLFTSAVTTTAIIVGLSGIKKKN